MKKLALAALIAVPAAAYPLATWMAGKTVEENLAAQYRQLETNPYLKVVKRDYQRGFYRSTETVTFELFGNLAAGQEEGEAIEPLRLTLRTDILHGPLPGLDTFAAATSETELVLDEAVLARFSELTGGKKPLAVHSVYRFDGSGHAVVSSPAFSVTVPAGEERPGGKLAWEGMRFEVESDRDMSYYTLAGGAPGLRFEGEDGSAVVMRDLKVEADQTRPFADVPMFYTGPTKMSIAEVSVREVGEGADMVRLGRMSFEGLTPMQGDYIDLLSRIGIEQVDVAGDNYGPVHYDVSLKHLHARSTASIYAAFMKMAAQPQAEDMVEQLKADMSGPVMELMHHNPEFSLDRISFMTPQGESRLSASVRLDGAQQEDFANPLMLLAKLDAKAEARLPEALVMMAAILDESATLVQGMAALEKEGYIRSEGDMLSIDARFAQGQLSLNGKPFDPMAFPATMSPEAEASLQGEAALEAEAALDAAEALPAWEEAEAASSMQD